jgi:hypothetical protein
VVPAPEVLPETWNCPEPHCRPGLSCDPCGKLGADLMKRWPNLIVEMGQSAIIPPVTGPIHWATVTIASQASFLTAARTRIRTTTPTCTRATASGADPRTSVRPEPLVDI